MPQQLVGQTGVDNGTLDYASPETHGKRSFDTVAVVLAISIPVSHYTFLIMFRNFNWAVGLIVKEPIGLIISTLVAIRHQYS